MAIFLVSLTLIRVLPSLGRYYNICILLVEEIIKSRMLDKDQVRKGSRITIKMLRKVYS
jgi:hypothetical protein